MKSIFKILLGGESKVGKTNVLIRYTRNYFKSDTKITAGIQFFLKTLKFQENVYKLSFFDFAGHPRYRFFQHRFTNGADAAIISFDLTRPESFFKINEWVAFFRQKNKDLPIFLIGTKWDLFFQTVIPDEVVNQFCSQYGLIQYIKISSRTGENVSVLFENVLRFLIDLDPRPVNNSFKDLIRGIKSMKNEFDSRKSFPYKILDGIPVCKINKFLTLKLEDGKTTLYVNNRLFTHCKYLLLNIPLKETRLAENIDSIDEAAESLSNILEGSRKLDEFNLTPELEFWGHCSNMEAWVENEYDTRILHRNLAFPLLKALTEAGDHIAKKVFKEEIAKRYLSNCESVKRYLEEEGYLRVLSREERELLYHLNEENRIIK
ncbi:MAG: putative Small GTP-binding domain protein, Ras-/Rab-domain signature [Promethearchaeota archaeon]|nr:MAG: putative Small GTP-binding domain protein, Ras-/Rab-domain signature [Candidatus Lokiarchaeota archaeon]